MEDFISPGSAADVGDPEADGPEAIRVRAHEAAAREDWAAAEQLARAYMDLAGETRPELFLLARAGRHQRKRELAIPLLQRLMEDAPADELADICDLLSDTLLGAARLAEAEAVLRRGLAVQQDAVMLERLADVVMFQKRPAEAAEIAAQALALDPGRTSARALLRVTEKTRNARTRHQVARLPKRLSQFADAREVIRSSVLQDYPQGARFIDQDTRFVTLGSCFATNLASYLSARGLDAFSEKIGEDVNNTYANRFLLDWLQHGVASKTAQVMQDAYGAELRERMRLALEQCDVFVFSLGVAPCFFDNETGEFFFVNSRAGGSVNLLLNHCRMRTTTVQENVDNLTAIIAAVNRIAVRPPTIVLTVSPVPLTATSEKSSAFIADCLSKSTLRLACEEVLQAHASGQVHYWPSFEIVRWLGPYFAPDHPPVFGAEDNKTRHVSNWVVSLIMDLFVETYWKAAAAAEQPDTVR